MDDGGGGGWGDDDDWGAMEDLSVSPSKPAKVGTLLLICNGSTLKFRYCVSFYNTCVFLTRVVILICLFFLTLVYSVLMSVNNVGMPKINNRLCFLHGQS